MILDKPLARRFLLAHHQLWPPRSLEGKAGVVAYIERVGCIQYDPVNIVNRNPDLVLQARVKDYRVETLDELLYRDRILLDGWDKVSSIHLQRDWPYFSRHRAYLQNHFNGSDEPAMKIASLVLQEIRERGPLSSLDIEHAESVDWMWGQPTRTVRAAMEILYATGELGIHHRLNTRRYFDLIERLLPPDLLKAPDPNSDEASYQDWHVLRRIGGMGLANPGGAEPWLGIRGLKAPQRRASLARLVEAGKALTVGLEGDSKRVFYMRAADLPTLEAAKNEESAELRAAFLPPLDNLLWSRDLLRWLFDFDYTWEVYKPAAQRKYGHYVLPVLYGDRFVARFDPQLERKAGRLTIRNWWWEAGVEPDNRMLEAIGDCLRQFLKFLGAVEVRLEAETGRDFGLKEILQSL